MTAKVKIGLVKSDSSSQKILGPKFFGLKFFLEPKCTCEWSLTLAFAQHVLLTFPPVNSKNVSLGKLGQVGKAILTRTTKLGPC